ncbi:MAG: glycosyltransferase [Bacillota bacterium]|nr:glycosyltransferase [Bacillota bacterium]
MRLLWSVNAMPAELASLCGIKSTTYSGGWLQAMQNELEKSDDISLYIAIEGKVINPIWYKGKKSIYVIIPSCEGSPYNSGCEADWQGVLEKIKPDIIHIHGTELPHSLCLFNCADGKYKTIISIQGLISEVYKNYLNGIPEKDLVLNTTVADLLRRSTVSNHLNMYGTLAGYEILLLQKAKNITGRTEWDKNTALSINPNLNYFYCNESLRDIFYQIQWDINSCKRNTLFFSQSVYPLKGLHILLDALIYVKEEIPDIKVFVGGDDIVNTSFKRKTFYGKYLKNKIKRLGLTENVIFTGILNEQQYAEYLQSANAFVMASSIENSSNSLCEAMLIGLPCIASATGGTPDLISDGVDGLLYPGGDSNKLGELILQLLRDDELTNKLSENSKNTAAIRHDKSANAEQLKNIYNTIIQQK